MGSRQDSDAATNGQAVGHDTEALPRGPPLDFGSGHGSVLHGEDRRAGR
jgi:hypothetical protein